MDKISSWSHSKLSDFEKCRFYAKLKHLDRIPEPERPLPPGKTEHANDRGSRIHDHAEQYVRGNVSEMMREMMKFSDEFTLLRKLFKKGIVHLEGEWGLDRDWVPTDWHTAWHRSKVDCLVMPEPTRAFVIDYKSGKRFGNEIKHAEQTQLYALNTVMRYPKVEEVTTELWYLDIDDISISTFTRDQILRLKPKFDRRGHMLTNCTSFPPNPNVHSCRWCQYGPWNGNQCTVGVKF